jgi:hypothetical protein
MYSLKPAEVTLSISLLLTLWFLLYGADFLDPTTMTEIIPKLPVNENKRRAPEPGIFVGSLPKNDPHKVEGELKG